jgi:hypothetical protein
MDDTLVNQEAGPVREKAEIAIRELDDATAETELRLRLSDFENTIQSLDEAEVVTQQTLQLEFSI